MDALIESTAPKDVVAAAGAWLGAALEPSGFAWSLRPARLERRVGPLIHQVHFQSSRYNRAGQSILVSTMLNIREPALRRWRRAHPGRTRVEAGDSVCGHPLGYASGRSGGYLYGSYEDGQIDLTDPATREAKLDAFAAMMREAVLPWFDEASDPDRIVTSRAADYTDPSLVIEWLASRDRPDLVDAYVDRYLSRHPDLRARYEAGRSSRPGATDDLAELLGRSHARLT
ncbi:hypothetical protein KOI35_37265 [Actinoplanes bogorensis]|uniref:DUF4304 domain-containing protein n=1 Tax=Paractinoplanes bogorensis TaxID=1610840 RepID=A0ABS5Z0F8_9ACTN|nr:hypothetical protein [Actinoplanes bogorensis]MBU2669178.1 hypothetical protein [Actinoplanes bogorensis]